MTLEAPKLDNRTFDQIYDQARLKIPHFAPEWTDFNDSDPGITLLQLFAWLSEMMLFQMNQIPELSYIKFLEMLGMQLAPARPATAHLTFTANPAASKAVSVPQFTQIEAQSEISDSPLIFETEKGVSLISRPLLDIQVFDGAGFTVVTPANERPYSRYFPFGWDPQINHAIYFGFEPLTDKDNKPLPAPEDTFPQQMSWRVFKAEEQLIGKPLNCEESATETDPSVTLIWEYRPSAESRYWQPLNTFRDESGAFTREGYILVQGPGEIAATREGRITDKRYWLRCRINDGAYTTAENVEIDFIRPNTVQAINLATVQQEVLGDSNGLPNQSFALQNQSIYPDSLAVEVERPDQPAEPWTLKPDFLASGRDDKHFTLDAVRGVLTFGDGVNGRIPVAGSTIVATRYRFGGGDVGNVGAGLIASLVNPPPQVTEVTNERKANGGQNAQTVAELKEQAPKQLRSQNRAVTAEDYESLALRAGGIGRAKAIPQFHPNHPGVDVPGAITIIVVPKANDRHKEPAPMPSAELRQSVCQFLNQYRVLTSELIVAAPKYSKINVAATVKVDAFRDFNVIKKNVIFAINDLFDPLGRKHSQDPNETRPKMWEFGQDLYPSGLFSTLLGVAGVRAVKNLRVFKNGTEVDLKKTVIMSDNELVYGDKNHDISVVPFTDQRQQG